MSDLQAEKRLVAELLKQTISDAYGSSQVRKRNRSCALRFIADARPESPFAECCEFIGVRASKVRRMLETDADMCMEALRRGLSGLSETKKEVSDDDQIFGDD